MVECLNCRQELWSLFLNEEYVVITKWYHNYGISILSMQNIGVLRGCIASKCWHLKRWLTLKISSILSLCSALRCRSTNPHEQTAIRPLVNSAPPWLCYYPSFEPWDAFPPPWFCQCYRCFLRSYLLHNRGCAVSSMYGKWHWEACCDHKVFLWSFFLVLKGLLIV